MAPFEYEQLADDSTCFRVLIIAPGDLGDEIRCTIIEDELTSTYFQYYALSYTWGDPTVKHNVQVNDRDFSVTENLYNALQHIRQQASDTIIWVDAMCINQSDLIEKSYQVSRMREIYTHAKEVLVWLGLGDSLTDNACEWIQRYKTQCVAEATDYLRPFKCKHKTAYTQLYSAYQAMCFCEDKDGYKLDGFGYERNDWDGWRYGIPPPTLCMSMDVIDGMRNLLNRSWWRRVWVIQEVVVNSLVSVLCGSSKVPWTAFMTTVRSISTSTRLLSSNQRLSMCQHAITMDDRRRTWVQAGKHSPDLIEVLLAGAGAEASDARDNVYALMGFAANFDPPRLSANYTLTVSQLYVRVATTIMSEEEDVRLICVSQPGATSNHKLPSWVPDWSAPRLWISFVHVLKAREEILRHDRGPYGRHETYLSNSIQPWECLRSKILLLPSLLIGYVDTLTESYGPPNGASKEWLLDILTWRAEAQKHILEPELSSENQILQDNQDFEPLLSGTESVHLLNELVATATSSKIVSKSSKNRMDRVRIRTLQHHIDRTFQHRRMGILNSTLKVTDVFHRTKSFHEVKCFVPETACLGDYVVMPAACQLPILIRRSLIAGREPQGEVFQLVGDVYISDYMHSLLNHHTGAPSSALVEYRIE